MRMDTMSENENAAPASRCARLRTKGSYLPPNPLADGRTPAGSTTAVWWCLATMKMMGPDDGYVAPDVCQPRRSCFRPEE